jgi:hypothetical protein
LAVRRGGAAVSICILVLLSSCATARGFLDSIEPKDRPIRGSLVPERPPGAAEDLTAESVALVARSHARESSPGAKVLASALRMMSGGTVVVGACWDYVNEAFKDAGFPAGKRLTVFSGPEGGPFADPTLIRPGDWLYFVNLTFGNIGHSAIFVDWIDFDARSAITIEYVGQNQAMPGRYREYDITKCFGIFRGKE